MRVSVVLPFYNAAGTLNEAIASIIEQGFTDFELILVDNKSEDSSTEIARSWKEKDARIKLILEQNEGVAFAMNAGIEIAQGDYVARMDADDISHPERLAKQVAFLDEHKEIDVLATRVEFISDLEQHNGYQHYVDWQNRFLSHDEMFAKRFVDAPLVQPTVMVRKEVYARYGLYDTGPLPEDFELWLRWFHAGVRFAKLPEVLFTWRDSYGRLSRSHSNFSTEAFDRTKSKWLANYLHREQTEKPIIALGTSVLCRERAFMLHQQGIEIAAFSDISGKTVPGYSFIEPQKLGNNQDKFIVSFISQRGAGDKISRYLSEELALTENQDFILTA